MKKKFNSKTNINLFGDTKMRPTSRIFMPNSLTDKNNILKIIERFCEKKNNQVMLVSSNAKKNGGVNFTKNIGGASSSLDKKTLLIDCDFSDYGLTKSLPVNKSAMGLTNVLKDESLAMSAVNTITPQLQVLTVGSITDKNQFIMQFPNFRNIVNIYRDNYDVIVINTAEKRDSFFSEIMYQNADQVVLATQTNAENINEIKTFKKLIESQNSELMGVIFND